MRICNVCLHSFLVGNIWEMFLLCPGLLHWRCKLANGKGSLPSRVCCWGFWFLWAGTEHQLEVSVRWRWGTPLWMNQSLIPEVVMLLSLATQKVLGDPPAPGVLRAPECCGQSSFCRLCWELLWVLAALLWFQWLLGQHLCPSQLSLSHLAPWTGSGAALPWGHGLNATGRRVDMEAPSDRMKHDTGWVCSPSEDEKAIQSRAKLSKGTGPVPAVWQLIQVSSAAWDGINIAMYFFSSEAPRLVRAWPRSPVWRAWHRWGHCVPRAWHEGMCTCLREHGLLGTCLEDCPEWGEPNLCVHTLRTLHQTSWVGLRRAETEWKRRRPHESADVCIGPEFSPHCKGRC